MDGAGIDHPDRANRREHPLPDQARNYMDRQPKLPTPQLDPHRVAAAILSAATTPARDVKVGMMATLEMAMEKLTPGLTDALSVLQVPRQQRDKPPSDPMGALYKPGRMGIVYGRGN